MSSRAQVIVWLAASIAIVQHVSLAFPAASLGEQHLAEHAQGNSHARVAMRADNSDTTKTACDYAKKASLYIAAILALGLIIKTTGFERWIKNWPIFGGPSEPFDSNQPYVYTQSELSTVADSREESSNLIIWIPMVALVLVALAAAWHYCQFGHLDWRRLFVAADEAEASSNEINLKGPNGEEMTANEDLPASEVVAAEESSQANSQEASPMTIIGQMPQHVLQMAPQGNQLLKPRKRGKTKPKKKTFHSTQPWPLPQVAAPESQQQQVNEPLDSMGNLAIPKKRKSKRLAFTAPQLSPQVDIQPHLPEIGKSEASPLSGMSMVSSVANVGKKKKKKSKGISNVPEPPTTQQGFVWQGQGQQQQNASSTLLVPQQLPATFQQAGQQQAFPPTQMQWSPQMVPHAEQWPPGQSAQSPFNLQQSSEQGSVQFQMPQGSANQALESSQQMAMIPPKKKKKRAAASPQLLP